MCNSPFLLPTTTTTKTTTWGYLDLWIQFLQSIFGTSQKRLVVEKRVHPLVELTPKGDIRLSLTMYFRLPPPILSDSPVMSGVPLQFELVSDYKLSPENIIEFTDGEKNEDALFNVFLMRFSWFRTLASK